MIYLLQTCLYLRILQCCSEGWFREQFYLSVINLMLMLPIQRPSL